MEKPKKIWNYNPRLWAGFIPNGLGQIKPHHYLEIFKTLWHNRKQLPFTYRILHNGVCDGCALGTTGLSDFTMDGVHLCLVRLNLLTLNTMDALDIRTLEDVSALKQKTSKELRALGRLPYPMLRKKGERGFTRISWDQAYAIEASAIKKTSPDRLAFFVTSRGLTNETYYVAQKAARFLGTNHVDNSSRICHSPSTVGLKTTLGVGASTCSYKDWIGTDLLVFLGSNVPNNQPVTTKYIYYAKQRGTKVAVVNPYREPGLERYWIPSVMESAVFGTKLADRFFEPHTGGDIAFLNGAAKHLIEKGLVDRAFVEAHTSGFEEFRQSLDRQSWDELESFSGTPRAEMKAFADMAGQAKTGVLVWSMGITQHAHGVQNVKAIVNFALLRGWLGREYCGLMPIRGHSGVQGGAEVGCVPNTFPGGDPVTDETARDWSRKWGFTTPPKPGLSAVGMIEAAHEGKLDVFHCAGGNFLETLPDPAYVEQALARVPLRVHQDIVLTQQMLVDPLDAVLLLPARTRYEQEGGGTETSTERQIIFSPEIKGRRVGESKSEWRIFMELAERAYPDRAEKIHFNDSQSIRNEISSAVPAYEGIQHLNKKGDAFQWGGRLLCRDGRFQTPNGKARFSVLEPPERLFKDGWFALSTRRGKQFNSIVQSPADPLTGAVRDAVFMHKDDAVRMGLSEGGEVLLTSSSGTMRGRVFLARIKPGNIQVHWPEGNVLLKHGLCDPACDIPDYNAAVRVEPLGAPTRVT